MDYKAPKEGIQALHSSGTDVKTPEVQYTSRSGAENNRPTSSRSITNERKISYPQKDQTWSPSQSKSHDGVSNPQSPPGRASESPPRSSPVETFSFETTLKGGFMLKVYSASVTRVDADVIVNAANDVMAHEGGVAQVISEAAGPSLDTESALYVEKFGPVAVNKNIVTTAGRLPYKAVIHAVGPVWYDYRDKVACLDDLFDCVYDVLETCKKERFKTVAMTAISAGIFGVPKELCADMYVYAAASFSKNLRQSEYPRELHIIDVDVRILKNVEESVTRWKHDSESLNQRKTIPKFLKENPHLAVISKRKKEELKKYEDRPPSASNENQRYPKSSDIKRYTSSNGAQRYTGPGGDGQRSLSSSERLHYPHTKDSHTYTSGIRNNRNTGPGGDGQRFSSGNDCQRCPRSSDSYAHSTDNRNQRHSPSSAGLQHTSSSYEGSRVHANGKKMGEKYEPDNVVASSVTRIKDHKFRWGGIAKQFVINQQMTVKIYQGDISKVRNVDALVCGMDKDLDLKGSLYNALKIAGGKEYERSCRRMIEKRKDENVKNAAVFKCEAGNLGVRYVLHAVVKKMVEANAREVEAYQDCMAGILQKARRNGWKQLAIPLIGTGLIQTNKRKLKLCGMALLKALDEFLVKQGDRHELNEVHLVNSKIEICDVLGDVFNGAADVKVNAGARQPTHDPNASSGHYHPYSTSRGRGSADARQGQGYIKRKSSNPGSSYSAYSGDRITARERVRNGGIRNDDRPYKYTADGESDKLSDQRVKTTNQREKGVGARNETCSFSDEEESLSDHRAESTRQTETPRKSEMQTDQRAFTRIPSDSDDFEGNLTIIDN